MAQNNALQGNLNEIKLIVELWRDWLIEQRLAVLDEPGRANSTWQLAEPHASAPSRTPATSDWSSSEPTAA